MRLFNGKATEWNDLITGLPGPHLLQTWEWSRVKARYGWEPKPYIWSMKANRSDMSDTINKFDFSDIFAAAMVLKRRIPIRGLAARLNILYIPKGPLLDWSDEPLRKRVLNDLQSFARKQGAIFLKIDPDVVLGTGVPERSPASPNVDIVKRQNNDGQAVMSILQRRGWMVSSDQIQFRNSVMIDLTAPEDELLARMKQKTRYNVRLAEKKGVAVRVGKVDDLPMLYKMYAETSVRDGFVIRDEEYYRTVWQTFMESRTPTCEPLIAEVVGEPVAAIFVFYFAGRAYYLYGMSREAHREKMPNYLLQWEAIRRAKAAGCYMYDLWGAPDVFDESDPMWGVFRFKEGLGGQVVRTLGAWDFTPKPLWYKMYSEVIPRVLDVMRARGKSRTRHVLDKRNSL
jgi:lipid II:glycine glycyltransferase (peptidoglycan interpeptide bridge formation enzyme)